MKFKVGERVLRKIDNQELTVVAATPENGGTYTLKEKSGYVTFHWWHDNELEKINEETNMERLPDCKTTKELGLKLGDRFIVEDPSNHSALEKGDVVTLSFDDGSVCPEFTVDRTGSRDWLSLRRLRPLPEFKEGDTLVNDGESYGRKVLGLVGDIVVTEDDDDESLNATRLGDLKDGGWELKGTEPETKEVTLGEIAEKFGVSVEQLRVKKGDE